MCRHCDEPKRTDEASLACLFLGWSESLGEKVYRGLARYVVNVERYMTCWCWPWIRWVKCRVQREDEELLISTRGGWLYLATVCSSVHQQALADGSEWLEYQLCYLSSDWCVVLHSARLMKEAVMPKSRCILDCSRVRAVDVGKKEKEKRMAAGEWSFKPVVA